jgi:hypothetical protein
VIRVVSAGIWKTFEQLLACGLFVMCVGAKCGSEPDSSGRQATGMNSPPNPPGRDTVYYLDFGKPILQQQIDSASARGGPYKFVQIEVTEVTNPKRRALIFDVSYRKQPGAESRLGSFSLYPPDNPGKFLVPTHNQVIDGGTVVLSLTSPDPRLEGEPIRVGISKLKLVNN